MSALTEPPSDAESRIRWLIQLRWLALMGIGLAIGLGVLGVVPGINTLVLVFVVAQGAITNLVMIHRLRRRAPIAERWQILIDTSSLTVVVWAAGGAECPFIGFYVFPILLAGLLDGRKAISPAAAAITAGLTFQVLTVRWPVLQIGRWDPSHRWADLLMVTAGTLTLGMVGYFAVRLTGALRQQLYAREQADAMLSLMVEGLDTALEVVQVRTVTWQNTQAEALFGQRANEPWRCPAVKTHGCRAQCHPTPASNGPRRCQFEVERGAGRTQIYEMLAFPLPHSQTQADRFMALYIDRTAEVMHERHLVLTNRLASLGRTVQGVAHELNTPLATIQTLGRDILDALSEADLPPALREDVESSAGIIVSEVQRCRRITHALLGRVDAGSGPERGGEQSLSTAVDRAISVVFPRHHERVTLQVLGGGEVRFPLDPIVQILVNLLQNALDAGGAGPIEVQLEMSADGPVVLVRDHGPGLSPAATARLFEPFYTTKPPGQGTGLGLFTSYALARDLDGELTLATHASGGALATLRLPHPSVSVRSTSG